MWHNTGHCKPDKHCQGCESFFRFIKYERIALIGANGCGKTTLLKMIMGKEQFDSGEIKIDALYTEWAERSGI